MLSREDFLMIRQRRQRCSTTYGHSTSYRLFRARCVAHLAYGRCLYLSTDFGGVVTCLCSLISMNLLPDELLKELSGG